MAALAPLLIPLSPAPAPTTAAIKDLAVQTVNFTGAPPPMMAWLSANLDPLSDRDRRALAPLVSRLPSDFVPRVQQHVSGLGFFSPPDGGTLLDELKKQALAADGDVRPFVRERARDISAAVASGELTDADAVERAAQDLRVFAVYPSGADAYIAISRLSKQLRGGGGKAADIARHMEAFFSADAKLHIIPGRQDDEALGRLVADRRSQL